MEGYTTIGDQGSRPQQPQPIRRWRTVAGLVVGAVCALSVSTLVSAASARSAQLAELRLDGVDRDSVETSMSSAPTQWTQTNRADPGSPMLLHLAVKHPDGLDLEAELLAVSTPGSDRYGQHLSLDTLNALTAPSAAALNAVQSWLARHGLEGTRKSAGSDFVSVWLTVAQAEELLDAQYFEFINEAEGTSATRTLSYSVPASVASHLDFVAPTVQFPNARGAASRTVLARNHADTHSYVTPSVLRTLYNLDASAVGSGNATSNFQVATGFLDEEYCSADLASFYQKFDFVTDLTGFEPGVVGSTTDDTPGCGDEANLDVQYLTAMAEQVPTEFWSFSGFSPDMPAINEPFLDFMLYLNARAQPPWVVSTSYGEDEGSTSNSYALRVQAEFVKAGLRGVSLFFASGDSGVGSMFAQNSCTKFTPQWPAASPWVTAVGATAGTSTESAADFSSGGFSERWAMPQYQRSTVEGYLSAEEELVRGYVSQELLPTKMLARNGTAGAGRAFPDVSAAGHKFMIVLNGGVYSVDGTSASTPVFAGIVSIVNEQRLRAGKGPLGFLNPLLYKFGSSTDMFNDITTGDNPGCGTSGFSAVEGWDPVTGLGTPNYAAFAEIALVLP